jgi:hypothetical protein
MDALSDVLRAVQLTGGVFLHAEFFAPWCIAARVSPDHCAPAVNGNPTIGMSASKVMAPFKPVIGAQDQIATVE